MLFFKIHLESSSQGVLPEQQQKLFLSMVLNINILNINELSYSISYRKNCQTTHSREIQEREAVLIGDPKE